MKLSWDLKEIVDFGKRLGDSYELETALMTATKEIAKVLHNTILINTPVDTGNLRKMWSAGDNLAFTIENVNNGYQVTLINTAQNEHGFKYGVAVNDGHKSRNGGWVMGRFFVERSVLVTANSARIQGIVRSELSKWFTRCVNG